MVLGAVLLLSVAVPAALRWMRPVYTSNYEQLKLRVDSLAPLVPSAKEGGKTSFERTDREARIFYFDPNTIPHDSLLMLGFSPKQASVIENYRRRGGFRTAEQFLRLYVVSNHQHLAGYIRIAQRRGAEPAAKADTPAAPPALAAVPAMRM